MICWRDLYEEADSELSWEAGRLVADKDIITMWRLLVSWAESLVEDMRSDVVASHHGQDASAAVAVVLDRPCCPRLSPNCVQPAQVRSTRDAYIFLLHILYLFKLIKPAGRTVNCTLYCTVLVHIFDWKNCLTNTALVYYWTFHAQKKSSWSDFYTNFATL